MVAVRIRKCPPAHPIMCPRHRDRAGSGGCACAAAVWASSWHWRRLPPQHPTGASGLASVGQKGPGQVQWHCECPAPARGAACPACAGSWHSSPPAHPSLPLQALQPSGLRAEVSRFLSGWRISLLRSMNYPQPVAHDPSASPPACLPGCRHGARLVPWVHWGPTAGSCLCTPCVQPGLLMSLQPHGVRTLAGLKCV